MRNIPTDRVRTAGWLVIETMGSSGHTLVFDTDRTKNFASISRRQHHRGDRVSAAIADVVSAVRTSSQPSERRVRLRDGSQVGLLGVPVFGPADVVFAVQVHLMPGDGATDSPVAERAIGAFEWNPVSQVTHHGKTMETQIFGVRDDPRAHRVSAEIFRHFDEFPRMAALGAFVAEIQAQQITTSGTFDSDLLLTGADGRQKSAYATFRAVQRSDRSWSMRGLVHDISDIKPPAPAAGYNAGIVRSVLRMMTHQQDSGIGHFNVPTRIVTEWFTDPPAPLDRWTTENAQIHPDDQPQFDKHMTMLSAGEVRIVEFDARVRFADTEWIAVTFDIRPASRGDTAQGLLKVTPLPPDTAVRIQGRVPSSATMASIVQRSGVESET